MTLLVGKGRYGKYDNWSQDRTHRKQSKLCGIFPDIWIPDQPDAEQPLGELPWRLSSAAKKILSERTKNIIWPRYMERMFYRGFSMWEKPNRMWKCRRKYRLLFHVLVVQLRDQVPAFREALKLFVWTIRRLDGQVYSYEDAKVLGILPGGRVLVRGSLKTLHQDMVKALVLVEGAVPIGWL